MQQPYAHFNFPLHSICYSALKGWQRLLILVNLKLVDFSVFFSLQVSSSYLVDMQDEGKSRAIIFAELSQSY